ncbi:MAG: hypothetical protein KFW21_04375 [Spirochaetota bacterium]|nr:hypothetical protein [Spirochaetota bacterium]
MYCPVDIEATFLKKVTGKTTYTDLVILPKDIDGTIYTRDSTNSLLKKRI